MAYWIARNNQKVGPYSLEDVQRLRTEGRLVASDLAWTEGMPNWGPALDVIPQPQPQEIPPKPALEPLAATRMIPAMRTPTVQSAPTPADRVPESPVEPAATPEPAFQPPVETVRPTAEPAPAPTAPAFDPLAPTRAMPASPVYAAAPAPAPPPAYSAPATPEPQPYRPPPPAAAPPPPSMAVQSQYQPYPPNQPYPLPNQPYPTPAQGPPAQGPPMYGQPVAIHAMPAQALPVSQSPVVPPGMHWALVLVLGWITFGIFYIIWMFKQANFVQRIDPSNPARKLFAIAILLLVVYVVIVTGAVVMQSGQSLAAAGSLGSLVDIAMIVVNVIAVFKIRASLVNYYNTVEPIGLRLSGAMTLFFNILYFQYHFHRIAQWKQTGMLVPQK